MVRLLLTVLLALPAPVARLVPFAPGGPGVPASTGPSRDAAPLATLATPPSAPAAASPAGGGVPDELERRLAELGDASATARRDAQAWLGRNVRREDYPRLVAAARAGDAEVRGRLAAVLASEERHLDLAVLFASEAPPELRAIGEGALVDAALRWNVELGEEPLRDERLARMLDRFEVRQVAPPLELDLSRPLAENVAALRLLGELPVGLVLDPALFVRPVPADRAPRLVSGSWRELVEALAHEHGAVLEGHGLGTPEEPGEPGERWLRLVSAADAGRDTGARALARWCVRAASRTDPAPLSSARALAASGWPAALGWLEERWRRDGDPVALQALTLSAAAGRVVPSLVEPAGTRALFEAADAALGGGDAGRADELARAFASGGCLTPAGEPRLGLLFERFGELRPRQRWWRLVACELAGCGLAPGAPERGVLRAVLADGSAPLPLRRQALRAWAALPLPPDEDAPPPPTVAGVGELVEDASRLEPRVPAERAARVALARTRELLADLLRARVAPPEAWSAPFAAADRTLAFAVAWHVARGEVETAGALLPACLAGASDRRLFELLRDALVRGDGAAVHAAFAGAVEASDARVRARLEPFAFRLGLLEGPAAELFRRRSGPLAEAPAELLGAWAVYGPEEQAAEARALLVQRFEQAVAGGGGAEENRDLLLAVEDAVAGLYVAGKDPEAEWVVVRVRRLLESRPASDLALDLARRVFPAPPRAAARPLELVARDVDPRLPR